MIRSSRTWGTIFWVVLIMAIFFQEAAQTAQPCTPRDHRAWIADVLKRMQTIKPGMTRKELLEVFTPDGGITTYGKEIDHGRFVSRDCSYCKVDVELKRVGQPNHSEGQLNGDSGDIILRISKPYLEPMFFD